MSDRSERAERSEQLEEAEKPAEEASSVNSVKWTRQQNQVIESRGKNLLVSAAAGSGKTAVLVERIIRLVTEGENPLDIDRLLVMTFTKAAAAEMRERIGMAIEQRLSANPDDAHLQMQSALIHHAQITTIDSFCLSVIREHFNLLDLDPAFRIGDEGEILLLRQDVMAELIEDRYANGGPEFERFVETYAQGKSDAGIENYITQVHTFSQSNPDPKRWLDQCRRELDQYQEEEKREKEERELELQNQQEETPAETGADEENPQMERENSPSWLTFLLEDARHQAQELVIQMTDALSICREDEFLDAYSPMFQSDIYQLKQIVSARDFDELYEVLSQIAWDRLATVRSKDVDLELKAYVSGCRDRMKKAVGKIKDLCCFATPSEMWKDMEATRDTVRTLLDLAEEFEERFQAKKRERALVDFNDLEHQALKVLIRFEEDGTMTFTDAADELSEQFEAVLVDEYQDSNLVQEALLKAVSGERFGRHNVFLVGDVKQSIYRFRLARPELFLEKYDSYKPYEEGEGNDKKIELHQNFRSRKEVLDAVNDVFYRIMTRNLGNIRYTEESALHAGAQFAPLPERKKRTDGEREEQIQRNPLIPELILADTGDAALSQMEEDAADYTAREIEARMIVQKIRELTDPESGVMVWDKALGEYRRASRRDIVILLRSTTGWSEVLTSVLMNEGIPAYAESRTGYFNTLEVETILSLLSVIDNPMQDIPLASVLRSPMCGMNDSELAQMMAGYQKTAKKGQDRGIYAALRFWMNKTQMQNGERTPVQSSDITNTTRAEKLPPWISKLEKFAGLLEELRMKSIYMPIHELIYEIYEKTGYERYVSAMPAGATRRANLEMLVEKAASYERTSYKGLFHFVRYVENLKKYNTDFGEASTLGEEDDTVRIMSIHKSKGLEFPIVILAGMGKKFNRQDVYGRILIDPELGIGTDYVDPEQRLKNMTLKKNVLKRKMELDSLGEELRVLYVAMTRAKEYLIMTGTDRSLEKTRVKYQRVPLADGQIPYTILASAGSYLDWILMACGSENVRIRIVEKRIPDLVGEELSRQIATKKQRTFLEKLDREKVYDPECREMLNQTLGKKYPYEADVTLHTKMSVSELKRQGQLTDDEESVCVERILGMNWEAWEMQEKKEEQQENQENSEILGMQKEQERPGVLSSEQSRSYGKTRGAERGTAYHRFFQLLDFSKVTCRQDIKVQRKKFVEEGRLSASANSYIRESLVWNFLQSDLGKRMSLAQSQGRLHKEQQFVVGIPARNMGAGDSDELVIVEGIMDAWFEDDGELVLMDYKTDYVEEEETLRSHYSSQLDYYARALSQMTGKKVREKLIYSLTLGREILIP